MSYLYVLHASGTNYYKIGITDQAIEQRLQNLQTGNHLRLDVVRLYDGLGTRQIEAEIHALLAHRRINGEWFELNSPTTVDVAIGRLGHKRYGFLSIPTKNLPVFLKQIVRTVLDAIVLGDKDTGRRKPKPAKLGKTYR